MKRALISVSDKTGVVEFARELVSLGWELLSTSGTMRMLKEAGLPVTSVSDVTGFPEICDGRVKTLHPKIFGGILGRRELEGDQQQMAEYAIPEIDLVIVDLYPFEQTVASGASDADIIEKIDIGGISLIRAGAKNFNDVVIVPSKEQYATLSEILKAQGAQTTLAQRRQFATAAFGVSSHYDTAIHEWFCSK